MNTEQASEIKPKMRSPAIEEFEENVLLISEIRGAVVLPYSLKEAQALLSAEPECADLRELIQKKYTVPLSRYKHGCISRVKETYALVRERGKGSAWKAFCLSSELFFKRLLHPAIITACKNTDWLDVYLDCLDRNELDEFPFFKIRYELNHPKNKQQVTSSDKR